jgi:hypothetical protein
LAPDHRGRDVGNPFRKEVCVAVQINCATAQSAKVQRPLDSDAPLETGLSLADPGLAWDQCYKTFYGRNLRIIVIS